MFHESLEQRTPVIIVRCKKQYGSLLKMPNLRISLEHKTFVLVRKWRQAVDMYLPDYSCMFQVFNMTKIQSIQSFKSRNSLELKYRGYQCATLTKSRPVKLSWWFIVVQRYQAPPIQQKETVQDFVYQFKIKKSFQFSSFQKHFLWKAIFKIKNVKNRNIRI